MTLNRDTAALQILTSLLGQNHYRQVGEVVIAQPIFGADKKLVVTEAVDLADALIEALGERDWIPYLGDTNPVERNDILLDVKFQNGATKTDLAGSFMWQVLNGPGSITHYRRHGTPK